MTGLRGFGEPIRLTLLTGFLGAGKTTLLNRLIADPAVTDTAVIVNEFGAVGIDHLLVETAADGLVELSDGCLCCTVRGDLADTLADLADRIQTGRIAPLRRVIVETTGLADPAPILALVIGHPVLAQAYRLAGVVTVADALAGEENLIAHEEARRQAAVADRLVIAKTDLADVVHVGRLRERLRTLNPVAPILDAARGEATPAQLLEGDPFDPAAGADAVRRWLTASDAVSDRDRFAHGGIRSFALRHTAPVPERDVYGFLDRLGAAQGKSILRMKAIVRTVETPERPLVLHGVRAYVHPPVRLAAWPPETVPASRLVIIGEHLDEARVRDLFAAFAGQARLDAPDREALFDNPLAVPGFRFRAG